MGIAFELSTVVSFEERRSGAASTSYQNGQPILNEPRAERRTLPRYWPVMNWRSRTAQW